MKLRLGDVLIETEHIESVEKVAPHTVKIFFASGNVIEVLCGIKGESKATWVQDANGFMQTVHNTDTLKPSNKENPK